MLIPREPRALGVSSTLAPWSMAVYGYIKNIQKWGSKGLAPWVVFAVIGLRDEKMRSIFSALEEPVGFFSSSWSCWTIRTPPWGTDPKEVEKKAELSWMREGGTIVIPQR